MTALGKKILEIWVSENVPMLHAADDVMVRSLTAKLKPDASATGLTMQDLELDKVIVESFIKEAILFQASRERQGIDKAAGVSFMISIKLISGKTPRVSN